MPTSEQKRFKKIMGWRLLLLACLFPLAGCQKIMSGILTEMINATNPALWEIQLVTVVARNQEGTWPASEADYLRIFGDSARYLFEDKAFDFHTNRDTLTINYTLLHPDKKKERQIMFSGEIVGGEVHSDSIRYHLNSKIQLVEYQNQFKPNEGRLTFYKSDEKTIHITHAYAKGFAVSTITDTR